MNSNTLPILILLGRPAAGKSEIIDYLKRTPLDVRIRRFHIGDFAEIDDFPLLWAWYEEDALLNRMGHPRLHMTADGYFTRRYLWDLLIQRLSLEYDKWVRDAAAGNTAILEFSRGSEHGGYRSALPNLSDIILQRAAILYIDVSWEESLRKNRRRFNPSKPDSILEHGLPDAKLERLYKEVDWREFSSPDGEYVVVRGQRVPYVVFDNEDDVTTGRAPALGDRLEDSLSRLWSLRGAGANQND
ncbi:MAG: hypothetical protein Q8O07_04485 [Chloroflexota bacterium]|nr:hypothetical protein [Chloroflexota bacterium]